MSDTDDKELINFLELKNLNQISIRIYYLYYRLLEAIKEQRTSLFRYSFDTTTAVVGGFLGFVSLFTFLKDLGDLYKIVSIVITIAVVVILLFLRKSQKPKNDEFRNLSDNLELAINLDQIFKQANECLLLITIIQKNITDSNIKTFLSDDYEIMKESLDYVNGLINKMKEDGTLDDGMKSIHITSAFLERRLTFGRLVLSKCENILTEHRRAPV